MLHIYNGNTTTVKEATIATNSTRTRIQTDGKGHFINERRSDRPRELLRWEPYLQRSGILCDLAQMCQWCPGGFLVSLCSLRRGYLCTYRSSVSSIWAENDLGVDVEDVQVGYMKVLISPYHREICTSCIHVMPLTKWVLNGKILRFGTYIDEEWYSMLQQRSSARSVV